MRKREYIKYAKDSNCFALYEPEDEKELQELKRAKIELAEVVYDCSYRFKMVINKWRKLGALDTASVDHILGEIVGLIRG